MSPIEFSKKLLRMWGGRLAILLIDDDGNEEELLLESLAVPLYSPRRKKTSSAIKSMAAIKRPKKIVRNLAAIKKPKRRKTSNENGFTNKASIDSGTPQQSYQPRQQQEVQHLQEQLKDLEYQKLQVERQQKLFQQTLQQQQQQQQQQQVQYQQLSHQQQQEVELRRHKVMLGHQQQRILGPQLQQNVPNFHSGVAEVVGDIGSDTVSTEYGHAFTGFPSFGADSGGNGFGQTTSKNPFAVTNSIDAFSHGFPPITKITDGAKLGMVELTSHASNNNRTKFCDNESTTTDLNANINANFNFYMKTHAKSVENVNVAITHINLEGEKQIRRKPKKAAIANIDGNMTSPLQPSSALSQATSATRNSSKVLRNVPAVIMKTAQLVHDGMRLSHSSDEEALNKLHCFVRSTLLEVFVVKPGNEDSDRCFPKNLVGIRCAICGRMSKDERGNEKMAVFFPKSVQDLYRGVCTWQRIHFGSCKHMPEEYKEQYKHYKNSDLTRGRKDHWINSAYEIGLRNVDSNRSGVTYDPNSKIEVQPIHDEIANVRKTPGKGSSRKRRQGKTKTSKTSPRINAGEKDTILAATGEHYDENYKHNINTGLGMVPEDHVHDFELFGIDFEDHDTGEPPSVA